MKKKLPLWLAAIVLIFSPIGISLIPGSDVSINLKMPENYNIGELIVLDASASQADVLMWKIIPETKNFVINGKIAMFCSPESVDYTIVISAVNDGYLNSRIYTLTPSKEEKVVRKLNDFETRVKAWVPPNALNTEELAQSFNIIASLIQVNTFENIESLMLATVRANRDALNNDLDNWVPFFKSLEDFLETNPPNTLIDHADLWKQIAKALKSVKT